MRLPSLLLLALCIAAQPALAGSADDPSTVTVLRGSSAPPVAQPDPAPAPTVVYREIEYLPAYYPDYYYPGYFLALPHRFGHRLLSPIPFAHGHK
jgi:hypothetical protein